MRVIAGIAKGHTLQAPRGIKTRPTTDRVREAIFSVLGDIVQAAKVLDCYAGSGALGIEAISRGAFNTVFFDRDRDAVISIKKNLAKTYFTEQAQIYSGDVVKLLPSFEGTLFDLVFLDPPYNKGEIAKIEPVLLQDGVLAVNAIVVLETNSKLPELFSSDGWDLRKVSNYGDTAVYYYKKN